MDEHLLPACTVQRMGSPDGPIRPLDRDAGSPSARRGRASASCGASSARMRPRRRASSRRTTHGSAPVRPDAPGSYWSASACSRMRSSRSLSSGVSSSPKSSASNTWRNLDLGLAVERVGAALDPLDRLFPGLQLDQPVAAIRRLRESVPPSCGGESLGGSSSNEGNSAAWWGPLGPLASDAARRAPARPRRGVGRGARLAEAEQL